MAEMDIRSSGSDVRSVRSSKKLVPSYLEEVRTRLKKRFWWCQLSAAIFAVMVIVPITYMVLDRTPYFIVSEGTTIPSEIKHGQTFQVARNMKLLRLLPCKGDVHWRIKDSQEKLTYLEILPSAIGLDGKLDEWTPVAGRPRVMPDSVASSTEKNDTIIQIDNVFYCNPLQRWLDWPIVQKHPPVKTTVLP